MNKTKIYNIFIYINFKKYNFDRIKNVSKSNRRIYTAFGTLQKCGPHLARCIFP